MKFFDTTPVGMCLVAFWILDFGFYFILFFSFLFSNQSFVRCDDAKPEHHHLSFVSSLHLCVCAYSGRVLNRFSRDVEIIDMQLAMMLQQSITSSFTLFFTVVAICVGSKGFFVPALLPIFHRKFFLSSKNLKSIFCLTNELKFNVFIIGKNASAWNVLKKIESRLNKRDA
jgi:ABC-type multidrug transport system fused ATPase/permease subunit